MDTMIYLDQENGRLTTPAIKSRQIRLHSAPDQCLRTPLTGKAPLGAPLQSGRKALGVLNKVVVSHEAEEKTKPAEAKCKTPAPPASEELPEIEKFFPYNPSDFEPFSVPDEVRLSPFSLAGLGKQTWRPASPVKEFILEPCLPLKMPKDPAVDYIDEMEAFLQTITELTDVDLPPECDF